jgi:hypothetical protein
MTAPWDSQFGMWLWDLNLSDGPDWRKITLDDFVELFASGPSYTMRYAYDSGIKTEYIGWAEPGTSTASVGWKIVKYTYSGNTVTSITFAGGSKGFGHTWDNYAIYSYS